MKKGSQEKETMELCLVKPKEMSPSNSWLAVIIVLLLLSGVVPKEYISETNRVIFFFTPGVCICFYIAYITTFVADYTIEGNITLEKETIQVFSETDNTTISLDMPVEIHIIDYESIEFGARTLYRISGAQNYILSTGGKFFFHLQNKRELKALRHFLNNQANRDKFLVID
jgi:hypothetical protein